MVNYICFKGFLLSISLLCSVFTSFAGISIGSWNLENFGIKKGSERIALIAATIKDLDVVAVQEVLISNGGAAAVAQLAEELNRTGAKWAYVISDVTTSENAQERERYAFLWKTAKVKLVGKPALAVKFESEICREPFMATFEREGKLFTLVNFHAIPKKKQPETEIRYLKFFKEYYRNNNLIFLGDFNCPQSNVVFGDLKAEHYKAAFSNQKTTLKQECKDNECLASEYDNIFYAAKAFIKNSSGILPFHQQFGSDMAAARKVSDHLPVFISFE